MTVNSGLVLDIILIAIVLFSIMHSAKRGAFRAVSGIVGTVGGFIGAKLLMTPALPIVTKILRPFVSATMSTPFGADITQWLDKIASSTVVSDVTAAMSALGLPSGFLDAFKESAASGAITVADAATNAMCSLLAPMIAFIGIFLLIKIAVNIACRILSFDIPIIRTLNKTAGALLGALSGLLLVAILCWALINFAPDAKVGYINQELLQQSYILRAAMPIFK